VSRLGRSQIRVLACLMNAEDDGVVISQPEVARELGISQQRVCEVTGRLVELGYVKRIKYLTRNRGRRWVLEVVHKQYGGRR